MKKIRITVKKVNHDRELIDEYGKAGLGLCPYHQVGQVFETTYTKPEGMCEDAWLCMERYVFALSAGADNIYDKRWVRDDKRLLVCCSDGLRPVDFELQVVDD